MRSRRSDGSSTIASPRFDKLVENKLDDLLKAIQGLSVDALKAAQLQGMLMGAIIAAIVLTFIVAITRK